MTNPISLSHYYKPIQPTNNRKLSAVHSDTPFLAGKHRTLRTRWRVQLSRLAQISLWTKSWMTRQMNQNKFRSRRAASGSIWIRSSRINSGSWTQWEVALSRKPIPKPQLVMAAWANNSSSRCKWNFLQSWASPHKPTNSKCRCKWI